MQLTTLLDWSVGQLGFAELELLSINCHISAPGVPARIRDAMHGAQSGQYAMHARSIPLSHVIPSSIRRAISWTEIGELGLDEREIAFSRVGSEAQAVGVNLLDARRCDPRQKCIERRGVIRDPGKNRRDVDPGVHSRGSEAPGCSEPSIWRWGSRLDATSQIAIGGDQ